MSFRAAVSLPLLSGFFLAASMPAAEMPLREIVVTNDLVLAQTALLSARLIVRASHVTIDGAGATLTGPGQMGDLKSLEEAGAGILIEGATDVTLKNLKARGFATGLVMRQACAVAVNRFGIWGRWGDAILLAANAFTNNTQGNFIQDVSNLVELPVNPSVQTSPSAEIVGPDVVQVGQAVRFYAATSGDVPGRSLAFHWWMDGQVADQPVFERTFSSPGFHRLGLTADNGALAGLAWRDLLVVQPVAQELGTEGQANRWGFELEWNDSAKGRVLFEDEPNGIVGNRCLRFTPNPYPGAYATAIYPSARDAGWNFTGRTSVRFWIKARNPNTPGWQNAGPVVRLLGRDGWIEFRPFRDANLLNEPPFSEARWTWLPVSIPLAGDAQWQRTMQGLVGLERIDAISLALDSWGNDPFTIWLDGLTVE